MSSWQKQTVRILPPHSPGKGSWLEVRTRSPVLALSPTDEDKNSLLITTCLQGHFQLTKPVPPLSHYPLAAAPSICQCLTYTVVQMTSQVLESQWTLLSGLGCVITLLRAKGCVLNLLPSVPGQRELQSATPTEADPKNITYNHSYPLSKQVLSRGFRFFLWWPIVRNGYYHTTWDTSTYIHVYEAETKAWQNNAYPYHKLYNLLFSFLSNFIPLGITMAITTLQFDSYSTNRFQWEVWEAWLQYLLCSNKTSQKNKRMPPPS